MTARATSAPVRTLRPAVSALDPHPLPATSLELAVRQAADALLGPREPRAGGAGSATSSASTWAASTLKTFADGEVYCRYQESIRGADVFIVQPTCGNPATGMTPNDSLMELLLMIDAAVGASAHRVIAVTPWFGYSRQDKKSSPREPISARLVARALESAGADRVLTMDLHAGQIQGFFPKPVDHMTALFMLTQYFSDLRLEDLVVVSPDAGRVKLAKNFASKIGAELAILNKERPAQQVAEIGYVIGDVAGRTAVIVDDMIGTAGTLKAAAQTVIDEGASRVYAAATHAVFSAGTAREPRLRELRADRRHGHDPAPPGRAGQRPRALLRRPPHGLDPPHLHRRLGVRGLRRREPAVLSAAHRRIDRARRRAVRQRLAASRANAARRARSPHGLAQAPETQGPGDVLPGLGVMRRWEASVAGTARARPRSLAATSEHCLNEGATK